ncbi:hypothetical protein GCM10009648_34400 [Tsukamurella spumae]
MTPDDLASRALSAAQASSYAFRVASEGTTATAQLGEVDVTEFLESETGKWAQGFIGIVRVGESLVHVSHALGELARSLQQVNLEQSEIVYQVEADIEAAQRQSAVAGVDPAERIAELIALARARATEVADKMPTPEQSTRKKKPAVGLVSGFMAFGRVPGTSTEGVERNGRVARTGHARNGEARNGYSVRNTRAAQNGKVEHNGHAEAAEAAPINETDGHDSTLETAPAALVEQDAAVRIEADAGTVEQDAAAAAQDAFANSGDETTMVFGFMSFGRTPSSAVPAEAEVVEPTDGVEPVAAVEPTVVEPTVGADVDAEVIEGPQIEDAAPAAPSDAIDSDLDVADVTDTNDAAPVAEIDEPASANGFLDLGRVPTRALPSADDAVVPQPLMNGFLAFGRTPTANGSSAAPVPAEPSAASSGPIPIMPPAQFVPIPASSPVAAEVAGQATDEAASALPLTDEAQSGPAPAVDEVLSFGRVPSTGAWAAGAGAVPTVPSSPDPEPVAVDPPAAIEPEVAEVDIEPDAVVDEAEPALIESEAVAAGPAEDADESRDAADDAADSSEEQNEAPADDEAPADLAAEQAAEADAEADMDADAADEAAAGDEDADAAGDADVLADAADVVDDADPAEDPDVTEDSEIENESAEPVEGTEPDPAEPADATEPDDVAETSEPADMAEPADATEPDDVAETSEPADSAEPADPAEPDDLVEDAAVADEADPAQGPDEPAPALESGPEPEPVPEPEPAPAAEPAPEPEPVRPQRPARQTAKTVKFSDLMKAAGRTPVTDEPVSFAVAAAADRRTVPDPPAEPETPAAPETPEAPAAPKAPPVLATGPVILGRTEPLVLTRRASPAVQQVHDAVASILGSLRGSPHGPDSGFHWAAGLLESDSEAIMVVTTSDAGWLPPGVVIPAGARVVWNMPTGYRWAAVDDPVRQLIEYATLEDLSLTAVATTHPSRAYSAVVGAENLVGVGRPGRILEGGRSRLEATVSPARLQHIRSLNAEEAGRQARALVRDLESVAITPEHAIGIEAARLDARCFLEAKGTVPPPVLDQLHRDEQALSDVLRLDRIPASAEDLFRPTPDARRLQDRMVERAIVVATLAAAYGDVDSALYAWTFARFLAGQDQDSNQAR